MSNEKKSPIIVLGMHRSGTSCLAGSLQESGVYFGDVSLENKYNKKGNRENIKIMNLNERILEYNHGSWDKPPKEIKWTSDHELEGTSIIKYFESEQSSASWGFKDPRTLLTFPFWENLLVTYKLVGTIRSPYSVALSLKTRDSSFTFAKGLQLWLKYNETLINILQKNTFPLLSFDLSNREYQLKLNLVKNKLSLPIINKDIFFDEALRSHFVDDDHQYSKQIKSCIFELEKFLI